MALLFVTIMEIEKRAKELGYNGIAPDIGEGKEEFYIEMGYMGASLFTVISPRYSGKTFAFFAFRFAKLLCPAHCPRITLRRNSKFIEVPIILTSLSVS